MSSPLPPTWYKDLTCYQIWPSSYKDSNGDGLGDIPGIGPTLDYLKDLGIGIIWLSPMYASPQEDMGYDISDYEAIYAPFGTMEDMNELIEETHKRGMRLILDLVINHTSEQHKFFQLSKQSRDNEYSDWYIWRNAKYDEKGARKPPNNWAAIWGGSAWEYVPERDQYYLHLFTTQQPDINFECDAARKAIYETAIDFWLEKGIDGFRVDTVNLYSKDTSFLDAEISDPAQEYQSPLKHVINGPRMHEFLKEIRRDVLSKYSQHIMMVGECAMTERSEVIRYVSASSKELDMVFDFSLLLVGRDFASPRSIPYTLPEIKAAISHTQSIMQETNSDAWATVFTENHDTTRSLSRFGTDNLQYRVQSGKLLAIFQATLSGTLFIYQGQEIGMTNIPDTWKIEDLKDVATWSVWNSETKTHPKDPTFEATLLQRLLKICRDNCRIPIQWDDSSPNAGFCPPDVKPWMRVHDDYKTINVAAALKDPGGIWGMWKKMLELRKKYRELFVYGTFEMVDFEDLNVFMYVKRATGTGEEGKTGKVLVVVLNFSSEVQGFKIPDGVEGREGLRLLVTNEEKVEEGTLSAWGARVYIAV